MAAWTTASSAGSALLTEGGIAMTAEMTSPTHVSKKRKTFVTPTLAAFEAIQAAYALPIGTTGETHTENVTSTPLSTVGAVLPIASSLSEPIPSANVTAAISSAMPPPMLTAAVTVTANPVSTPLASSVAPTTLLDLSLSIFPTTAKETPAVSLAHEATSAGDHATGDIGGSSSGIADDGARLGDDLYLPTINWDSNTRDKQYQSQWKIAESSRLIFPQVVQHWVDRAYPPAEAAYVEGLNNENLMNSTIVDSACQPRRLAEIRRRWMHDNNELHQARALIE
ncbi:hypothetical protein Hanom_Chr03g00189501 [Helianthus anomalus]